MTIPTSLRLAGAGVFAALSLTACASGGETTENAALALNPFSCTLDLAESEPGQAAEMGRMICGEDSVEVIANGEGLTGALGDAGWQVTETTVGSEHNGDFNVVYFSGPFDETRQIDCTAVSTEPPITNISCGTVPTEEAMAESAEMAEEDHEGEEHAHEEEMTPTPPEEMPVGEEESLPDAG